MLSPETGFKLLSWEVAFVSLSFFAWLGNLILSPRQQDHATLHPYANAVSTALIGMLVGILSILEIFRLYNEEYALWHIGVVLALMFVLLIVLHRMPFLWNCEHGVIVGLIVGAAASSIMLVKLLF